MFSQSSAKNNSAGTVFREIAHRISHYIEEESKMQCEIIEEWDDFFAAFPNENIEIYFTNLKIYAH